MKKTFFILCLIGLSALNLYVIKKEGLLFRQQYREEQIIKPTIFYTKRGSREKIGFIIDKYFVSCNMRQLINCNIDEQIYKINYVNLTISFRLEDSVEIFSDAYVREISYIDKQGQNQLLIMSNEQINRGKSYHFISRKAMYFFMIVFSYLLLIMYFWDLNIKIKSYLIVVCIFSFVSIILYGLYI